MQKQKESLILYLPVAGLVLLVLLLYLPLIPVLFGLPFMDKTTMLLTFAIAVFAAIEGYSTFSRTSMELKREKIEDARNELEKAYGPIYTLLNKVRGASQTKDSFWLDFDERKRLDEIMATYPFMFPPEINALWQDRIRNLGSLLQTTNLKSSDFEGSLGVYLELRNLINEEYARRVKSYRDLLGN